MKDTLEHIKSFLFSSTVHAWKSVQSHVEALGADKTVGPASGSESGHLLCASGGSVSA
jgi:hypothetical protein